MCVLSVMEILCKIIFHETRLIYNGLNSMHYICNMQIWNSMMCDSLNYFITYVGILLTNKHINEVEIIQLT